MKKVIISLIITFFSFNYVSAGGPSQSYLENHPNSGTMGSTYWETEYKTNKEKFNMYDFQNYTYDLTIIFKKDLRTKIVCKKEVKNGEELQIREEDDICNSFTLFPAFMSASNFSFNKTYNFPDKYNSFFKTEITISNFKLSNIDKERNNNLKELKKLYKELDTKALILEKDFNNFCDIVETQYTNKNIKEFGLLIAINSDIEGEKNLTFHFDSSNQDETKRIDGLYKMSCVSSVIDAEGHKTWKREKFNIKKFIDEAFDIIDYEENYIFPKKNDLLLEHIKKFKNILGKIKFESSFLKDGKYFKKVNINFGVGTYVYEFNDYVLNKNGLENDNKISTNTINKTKTQLTKQLIISKIHLKNKKYGKIIVKLDKIIPKISDIKLIKIDAKIDKIISKLRKKEKFRDIINYLEAKIKLELLKRYITEEETKITYIFEGIQKKINVSNGESISKIYFNDNSIFKKVNSSNIDNLLGFQKGIIGNSLWPKTENFSLNAIKRKGNFLIFEFEQSLYIVMDSGFNTTGGRYLIVKNDIIYLSGMQDASMRALSINNKSIKDFVSKGNWSFN